MVVLVTSCARPAPIVRLPDPAPPVTPSTERAVPARRNVIVIDTYPGMLDRDYKHHFEIDSDGTTRNTISPDRLSHGVYVCKMPRERVDELIAAFVAAGYDDLARGIDGPNDWCVPLTDRGLTGWSCRPASHWMTDVGGIALAFHRGTVLVHVDDVGNHTYRQADQLDALVEGAIEDDSCR